MLDAILENVDGPDVDVDGPFQLQVATINYDDFVGRIAVGRIERGSITKGTPICVDIDGKERRGKVTRLLGFEGLAQIDIPKGQAGHIVGIAGFTDTLPGETMCDPSQVDQLPPIAVDEPTISMEFIANNGPFSGQSGSTSPAEISGTVWNENSSQMFPPRGASRLRRCLPGIGRGELHIGILIETMRREGYELIVSMPKVILREGENGTEEPYEDVTIDRAEPYSGAVIQDLTQRGGELRDMRNDGDDSYRIPDSKPRVDRVPEPFPHPDSRHRHTLQDVFRLWPFKGEFQRRHNGVLIALETGQVTSYALETCRSAASSSSNLETACMQDRSWVRTRGHRILWPTLQGEEVDNMRRPSRMWTRN